MANIHWFPGHMNKALNEIKEKGFDEKKSAKEIEEFYLAKAKN